MSGLPADLFDSARYYVDTAFRNIVSLRKSRNLFARVSDEAADADAAIAAEMATRPRRRQASINRPFEPWYGVIGFPFDRRRWAASRYSDGSFGVWYGSKTIETTIHETVHHFRDELAGRGWNRHPQPIVRERRVVRAHVDALVFDLCGKENSHPGLIDPRDYALTHDIGRVVNAGHHPGLLAPSARQPGGVNVNIFDPSYISDPRDVCYLTYRHGPDGSVEVEREPGRFWLRV